MPDKHSHHTNPSQQGSVPSQACSKPPSSTQDSQRLPSRYSIDNATYNAAPHHVYTFQVGPDQSCLLKSSYTDGKEYIPEVIKYTGATVVQGDILSPGEEYTYRVNKDGVMKELLDKGNPTLTGSEEEEEEEEEEANEST
jgi:hypothetical protein